jgi:hypothetical protein
MPLPARALSVVAPSSPSQERPCAVVSGPGLRRGRLGAGVLGIVFVAALGSVLGSGGCLTERGGTDYGPDDGGTEDGGTQPTKPGQLVISPSPVNVDATMGEQKVQFTAFSTSYGDVSKRAAWTLSEPGIGTVSKGLLTVRGGLDQGGKVLVYASYGIQNGVGIVNLKVNAQDFLDPSAPPNAKDHFTGGAGGPAPSWVYPLDGTMLPRNLLQVNLQWSGIAGAAAYRVRVDSPTYARSYYVGPGACSGMQCKLQLPDDAWTQLTRSAAGQEVSFSVSASTGVGAAFGTSENKLSFSPDDVKGGLYYWSTTITGIYRVPLGAKTAQVFINRGNEYGCSGCHAVSRDGKKVALEFGSANGTGGGVVDGTDGKKYIIKPPSAGQWNLQTFSPMGDMLLVNWQQRGRVIDSTTGAKLFDFPEKLAQPEWSPDGQSIVYVSYSSGGSGDEWNANNIGDIMVIPWNGGAWGAPQTIVAAKPNSEYHFYPSWTPDSKWIIFNTGKVPCKGGSGCNTYDPTNTTLRIVRAMPGEKPIELRRAVYRDNSGTNWPRVAPFIQNGKLVFFTFSARFPYGFIKSGSNPQIWMAGVDLERAEKEPDQDPSFAPFWLPFQSPSESNHLGTWTTDVACISDAECPAEFMCQMGACVPKIG